MKEYIAIEHQTENGGYIETVSELIRCKDCKHLWKLESGKIKSVCRKYGCEKDITGYCDQVERREE